MVLAKELVDKLKKIEDFDITYESSDKDSGEIYIDYNNIVFVLEHYIYEGKFYLSGGLHTITYKGKEYYSDVLPYYLDVDYDSDTYNGVDELVSMIEDDIKGCDFKKKLRRLISVVDSIYEDFDEAEVEFIKKAVKSFAEQLAEVKNIFKTSYDQAIALNAAIAEDIKVKQNEIASIQTQIDFNSQVAEDNSKYIAKLKELIS